MALKELVLGAAILAMSQTTWAQEASFHNWEVRLAALPGMQSYALSGTGFNTTNGMTSGDGAGGGITWYRQNFALSADFTSLNTKMIAPGSVTQKNSTNNTIATKFDHAMLNLHLMNPEDGVEKSFNDRSPKGLTYVLGMEYRGRTADETTPTVFMPSSNSYGVRLGVGYSKALDENFSFTSAFGLYFPLYFDETSKKTGYYRIGLYPDAAVDMVYKVNNFIDFSLGIHATYEQTYYADTGTRGVANATETTTNIYAPVELRFQF